MGAGDKLNANNSSLNNGIIERTKYLAQDTALDPTAGTPAEIARYARGLDYNRNATDQLALMEKVGARGCFECHYISDTKARIRGGRVRNPDGGSNLVGDFTIDCSTWGAGGARFIYLDLVDYHIKASAMPVGTDLTKLLLYVLNCASASSTWDKVDGEYRNDDFRPNFIFGSSGGGGVSIHNDLTGRDIADGHSIGAITDLQTALDAKSNVADIQDVLTSTDTAKSLSANMGRELKGAQDTQQGEIDGKIDVQNFSYITTGDTLEIGKSYGRNIHNDAVVNLPESNTSGHGYILITNKNAVSTTATKITLAPFGSDKINGVAGNYEMPADTTILMLSDNYNSDWVFVQVYSEQASGGGSTLNAVCTTATELQTAMHELENGDYTEGHIVVVDHIVWGDQSLYPTITKPLAMYGESISRSAKITFGNGDYIRNIPTEENPQSLFSFTNLKFATGGGSESMVLATSYSGANYPNGKIGFYNCKFTGSHGRAVSVQHNGSVFLEMIGCKDDGRTSPVQLIYHNINTSITGRGLTTNIVNCNFQSPFYRYNASGTGSYSKIAIANSAITSNVDNWYRSGSDTNGYFEVQYANDSAIDWSKEGANALPTQVNTSTGWAGGATRPTAPKLYTPFFDTVLGYPIWHDGSDWVNADGTVV